MKILVEDNRIINKNSESLLIKDTQTSNAHSNSRIIIKEVKYRWVIFVCFCCLTFSNAIQWVTFSPIADDLISKLEYNSILIDTFGLVFLYVYPFIFPIAAYLIDNKSPKYGLIIAALFNIIGSILKIFINYNLYLSLFGQILAAIAQPFIISSCAKIANIWFRNETRTLITSLFVLSNIIGSLFGIIFNTFIFSSTFTSTSNYRDELFYYLLYESILIFILSLPTVFLFKSKPKYAPSISQNNQITPKFLDEFGLLFKNKNFIFLLFIIIIIVGYFNMIGVILSQYMAFYNINRDDTSIIGGVGNLLGIIGSIIGSVIIDKYKNYRIIYIIFLSIGCSIQLILSFLLEFLPASYNYITIMISFFLILLYVVPCIGIGMDYACEITYPVGEMFSNGLIMSGGQLVGIAEVYIADFAIKENKVYIINIMISITFIISILSIFLLKEDLKRNNMEHSEAIDNPERKKEIDFSDDEDEEKENRKDENIGNQNIETSNDENFIIKSSDLKSNNNDL